jgi:hypothetical protein
MQSYHVYVLGQLCQERSDELAKAYQQAQRQASERDGAPRSLRRVLARMRELNRAPAYRA